MGNMNATDRRVPCTASTEDDDHDPCDDQNIGKEETVEGGGGEPRSLTYATGDSSTTLSPDQT